MKQFNGKNGELTHVISPVGMIIWDGITQPETKTDGSGAIVHSLKIAIPAADPERMDLDDLANQTLADSTIFKGQFPAGGEWPLREIDLTKFEADAPLLQGRIAINANTRLGAPLVYDINGNELSAMQYARMLYPGALVKVMVHCYDFNNKSKGLAFGLDGIQIIDATTPKLAVTGGISKETVAGGFAAARGNAPANTGAPAPGPAAPAPAAPAPAAEAPAAPAPDFVANAGKQMTAKANGVTYDAFRAKGWTDEMLIAQGYMVG